MKTPFVTIVGLLIGTGATACEHIGAGELTSEFVSSQVTRKVGGYRPIRAEMDADATIVKVAPEDLRNPKYGEFKFGEQSWAFILDEPAEKSKPGDEAEEDAADEDKAEQSDAEESEVTADDVHRIYVDSNGDGDLTNDPPAKYSARKSGQLTQYTGEATIELGPERVGRIAFYRFDPNDKRRASLKNTVLYYADFGAKYRFQLDGREFETYVAGLPSEETSLSVDRDGNGRISSRLERAQVGEPFNFTGTTYLFELKDSELLLSEADEELDQLPLPPDLSVGKTALTFEATTMSGDKVRFPEDYAGKIVMLDFWATWCGPCIREIPNVKQAYQDWHADGFEILGVSFDNADMEEKVEAFLTKYELPWTQIYEGKRWDSAIGRQHDVGGIPFVLLVDGDTHEILATARQLRGPGLSGFIEEQLKKKGNLTEGDSGADSTDSGADSKEDVAEDQSEPDDSGK